MDESGTAAGISEAGERKPGFGKIAKCPMCGADLPDGAAFCPACGARQGASPKPQGPRVVTANGMENIRIKDSDIRTWADPEMIQHGDARQIAPAFAGGEEDSLIPVPETGTALAIRLALTAAAAISAFAAAADGARRLMSAVAADRIAVMFGAPGDGISVAVAIFLAALGGALASIAGAALSAGAQRWRAGWKLLAAGAAMMTACAAMRVIDGINCFPPASAAFFLAGASAMTRRLAVRRASRGGSLAYPAPLPSARRIGAVFESLLCALLFSALVLFRLFEFRFPLGGLARLLHAEYILIALRYAPLFLITYRRGAWWGGMTASVAAAIVVGCYRLLGGAEASAAMAEMAMRMSACACFGIAGVYPPKRALCTIGSFAVYFICCELAAFMASPAAPGADPLPHLLNMLPSLVVSALAASAICGIITHLSAVRASISER